MKRLYIAGSGGMLGDAFYKFTKDKFISKFTDKVKTSEWIDELDFRNYDNYFNDVKDFKPDIIFHIGAYTDLEYCETHQDDTYATNAIAVENAVYIANKLDIPILYISTAGIFDGSKDTFDDWDLPNPMGHYARSKYAGELFVEKNAPRHLICRAGWMMGGGPKKDKKFIKKIMVQLKDGKKELFVVNDKLGTPTYTHDFARNVKLLIEKEFWGLYNMVCDGITGRFEVAQELIKALNLEDEVKVTPVDSEFWKGEYFADRPPSERLINRKLDVRGLNVMRDWRVCLEEYIAVYYKDYLK